MGSKTVRREACHTKCWGHGFGAGREEIFVLTLTPTALWRCRSVCSFICSLLCVQQEQRIYTAVLALILLMWMKEYACQWGLNINVFSFLQLINYLGTSFSFVKGKQSPVWTPWLGTGCFLWHCLLSSWDRRHWSPLVGFSVPFPPFPKLLFHTFALFFFFSPLHILCMEIQNITWVCVGIYVYEFVACTQMSLPVPTNENEQNKTEICIQVCTLRRTASSKIKQPSPVCNRYLI